MRTAVIGAGVSGLVCASSLAERGIAVTVFESARGPGGRMSQRRERTEDGKELCFDHGAPYFTVKDPSVCDVVDKWEGAGLVAEWKGPFGTFDVDSGKFMPQLENSMKRYVGVPGMNSICKAICHQPGVEAKFGVTVAKLQWREEDGYWDLKGLQGEEIGQFEAVVASDKNLASPRFTIQTGLPPPLDSAGVPELVQKMQTMSAIPCFAVMLALSQPLTSIPVHGYTVVGSKLLSWASCDSRKPGRSKSGSECWVLHSTAEYANQIISKTGLNKPSDDILNNVKRDLFGEFQKTVPDITSPFFMKAHRWGSAFPATNLAKDDKCLWVEKERLVICGDFCVSPDVEGAILSGLAAASKLSKVYSTL
ncbi:hypothetical protein SUGI_1115890 [Cryptomeria japonica]|uniref:uncharacterized protein LOC131031362 isoform X2 n=1 Tax=Cryptomeria japonica TaxID=3369 RepID=UPI002414AA21|nr:uncharacterized protein LOC131031362 isoform X2 [Cryptomeria japonica]GLJ52462.1 hypothetical protein SUGI_1115890 [Cryptomeria japonica]